MADEQHIIEKVKVDVEVETVELAERIKSEINDFVQKEVLTIIESYFADLNVPEELRDKVIQLNRVDLSLETTSWNPNSVGMKQDLRDEVEKQMNPIIADLRETLIKDQLSVSNGFDPIREEQANVYSKEERTLKSVFYFLEHGILPWWLNSVNESRELFSEKSLMNALRRQPEFAQKQFVKLRRNEQVISRLVRQFSISVVSEFIQLGLSSQRTESAQRLERTSFILQEFRQVPGHLVNSILQLTLDLSEEKVLSDVFHTNANEKLFRYLHEKFSQRDLNEEVLTTVIKTTYALRRILHVLAGKSNQLETLKREFIAMLKKELPSDSLASLKETKVLERLFESNIDPKEDGAIESATEKTAFSAESNPLSVDEVTERKRHQSDELSDSEKFEKDEAIESSKESDLKEESAISDTENSLKSNEIENKLKDEVKAENSDNANEIDNVSDETENANSKGPTENEPSLNEGTTSENSKESTRNSTSSNVEDELRAESQSNQDTGKEKSPKEAEEKENQSVELADSSTQTSEKQQSGENTREDESQNLSMDADNKSDLISDATQADTDYDSNQERKAATEKDGLSEVLRKEKDAELHKKRKTEEMPNELFVSNAGLVLLNPFVPALFKKLELIGDDGKLTNPEVAAVLLHYAATGREGDYEFEMAFEKYLCGIPPSIPINREITLTQAQKDEVGVVLNSVLQHWTALKSKSPELLRNEFLSRSGKLIVEKSNHRLIIERKTFDLLLDKLPWTYSLVKFSWKKDLIFVEW